MNIIPGTGKPSQESPTNLGDRDNFAIRQAEMTQKWFESVKSRFVDVEKYIESRQVAYIDRWREAYRFFCSSAKVLDVGGGNLYDSLLRYIKDSELEYWYQDVDPGAVEGARKIGKSFGIGPNRFLKALNDYYPYEDESFDAVFSSHCIEHSIDLPKTLSEISRILRAGGMFTLAVPLGWEANPEHPYFFDEQHWILLLEDFGFEIRVAQIGRMYPESGVDLFIAARKKQPPTAARRIDVPVFTKESYSFVRFDDPRIKIYGTSHLIEDEAAVKLVNEDWRIHLHFPTSDFVVPVFARHDWSGIIKISNSGQVSTEDLFRWYATIQPVILHNKKTSDEIKLTSAGRNAASRGSEAILYGAMIR